MFFETRCTKGPGVSVASCHISVLILCGIGKEFNAEFFNVSDVASL